MPKLKNKYQFCKCNNCGEVFFDTNPNSQPFFEIPKGKTYNELETINKEGEFFKGCFNCETDEYLMDIENENQL